jgi:hypothetical protein
VVQGVVCKPTTVGLDFAGQSMSMDFKTVPVPAGVTPPKNCPNPPQTPYPGAYCAVVTISGDGAALYTTTTVIADTSGHARVSHLALGVNGC